MKCLLQNELVAMHKQDCRCPYNSMDINETYASLEPRMKPVINDICATQ